MKRESIERDNQKLIEFWNQAFALSEEQKTEIMNLQEDWKELAPSEKLFQAACSLGQRKKVLDFGCGTAWAAIIAAKSGCTDVTAADAAPAAVQAGRLYAMRYDAA
ncbi:MAG: 50S ribosomal protein L11 methyltransferase, partial [Clostridia bacterium]|nr:50S ribosomal protein L11 methyltransferase [Clostridia bacterium]